MTVTLILLRCCYKVKDMTECAEPYKKELMKVLVLMDSEVKWAPKILPTSESNRLFELFFRNVEQSIYVFTRIALMYPLLHVERHQLGLDICWKDDWYYSVLYCTCLKPIHFTPTAWTNYFRNLLHCLASVPGFVWLERLATDSFKKRVRCLSRSASDKMTITRGWLHLDYQPNSIDFTLTLDLTLVPKCWQIWQSRFFQRRQLYLLTSTAFFTDVQAEGEYSEFFHRLLLSNRTLPSLRTRTVAHMYENSEGVRTSVLIGSSPPLSPFHRLSHRKHLNATPPPGTWPLPVYWRSTSDASCKLW